MTFFNQGRENDALPKSQQAFEDATVQTFGPINFVFSQQTFFFEFEHPFIDKPIIICCDKATV